MSPRPASPQPRLRRRRRRHRRPPCAVAFRPVAVAVVSAQRRLCRSEACQGDAPRRAAHVVQTDAVAEIDAAGVTTMPVRGWEDGRMERLDEEYCSSLFFFLSLLSLCLSLTLAG